MSSGQLPALSFQLSIRTKEPLAAGGWQLDFLESVYFTPKQYSVPSYVAI